MDNIIQWLTSGKDYAEGVAVLDRHTRNRALIRHFRSTTPKFAAAKLEYDYTSIENIHKVIDPLFMNDLQAEFDAIAELKSVKRRTEQLCEFQKKLATLTFLDPACGSGNFLTETYLSLRRLENACLRLIYDTDTKGTQIGFADYNIIKVRIQQFYGIEINDFAVTVAKTALWIAESQMIEETENIVSHRIEFLPLTNYANIVEGNALQLDWKNHIKRQAK